MKINIIFVSVKVNVTLKHHCCGEFYNRLHRVRQFRGDDFVGVGCRFKPDTPIKYATYARRHGEWAIGIGCRRINRIRRRRADAASDGDFSYALRSVKLPHARTHIHTDTHTSQYTTTQYRRLVSCIDSKLKQLNLSPRDLVSNSCILSSLLDCYPRRARSAIGVDTVFTLDVCLYVC